MKFAVESWAPEYGISADQSQLEEAGNNVDVTIEVAIDDWAPIMPIAGSVSERILFVDGVRRIDARVWFDDNGVTRPGVCASVAAGSVWSADGKAIVKEANVARGFFTRATDAAGPISTKHGTYLYFPCTGDTPEDVYLGIHEQMTLLEAKMAARHEADLVVFDGPLRGRNDPLAVGYVKTQHVQYLPDDLQPVLGRLKAGERTPLFLIGGRGRTSYSWYLRLPGPIAQPLSGIVRCEVNAQGTVKNASQRADDITMTLPRFASEPHKDPRAPQNLYPIAGLEHQLRHRLGDQQLMERALRSSAANVPRSVDDRGRVGGNR
jgi:hypothetical protein